MPVVVIAEAGVNHNGDKDMALALVDAAADAGADVVKFQTFRAEELASAAAPKAEYQNRLTDPADTQQEMLRRLELSEEMHHVLMDHCRQCGIAFLSTAFDLVSLAFLSNVLKLDTLKIPSGEITNGPLLFQAGRRFGRIVLSTGMTTMDEVADALGVLAVAFTAPDASFTQSAGRAALQSSAGHAALVERVTLLHCTTEYPAPFEDTNLRAMQTLGDTFGLPIGLSDHTPGIAAPIAAAALGAVLIEKHFTMDRSLPGPDHMASLEPGEFTEMISGIRAVEMAMGDGIKQPRPSEIANMRIARKSLVARRKIRAGELFSEENLGAKRPGDGLSPMAFWDLLGQPATRDYAIDEQIETGS
jgi:N-acetylneuraminate synthase